MHVLASFGTNKRVSPMDWCTQQLLHIPQKDIQCVRISLCPYLCKNEGFGNIWYKEKWWVIWEIFILHTYFKTVYVLIQLLWRPTRIQNDSTHLSPLKHGVGPRCKMPRDLSCPCITFHQNSGIWRLTPAANQSVKWKWSFWILSITESIKTYRAHAVTDNHN